MPLEREYIRRIEFFTEWKLLFLSSKKRNTFEILILEDFFLSNFQILLQQKEYKSGYSSLNLECNKA